MPKNVQTIITIALISHASKIMLKILQVRLLQYVNRELPEVQAGFRKAEEPEIKLPASFESLKNKKVPEKNIDFCFIDYTKIFDCVDHYKLWKLLKQTGIPDYLTWPWQICMQVKMQQLELGMEQQTGSK